ncbi:hypothetical protein ILYODFUR_014742 [Ilyodon furcidens]|uniref:Secreted protein n=1 Tax=Ilyodon furcidens TaxID=33524 RepID=A0ABV0TUQ1_9TELE
MHRIRFVFLAVYSSLQSLQGNTETHRTNNHAHTHSHHSLGQFRDPQSKNRHGNSMQKNQSGSQTQDLLAAKQQCYQLHHHVALCQTYLIKIVAKNSKSDFLRHI